MNAWGNRSRVWLTCLTGLICACLLLPVAEAAAQASGGFGVKAGLQWADFRGDGTGEVAEVKRASGLSIGAVFTRRGTKYVLRPEILYSKRVLDLVGADPTGGTQLEATYIEVPVLLRVGAPMGSASSTPVLLLGPYAAYKLDVKTVASGDVGEIDVSDDFEDIDYGLVLGAGMEFGSFAVDARYVIGLRKLFTAVEGDQPDIKHHALGIFATLNL